MCCQYIKKDSVLNSVIDFQGLHYIFWYWKLCYTGGITYRLFVFSLIFLNIVHEQWRYPKTPFFDNLHELHWTQERKSRTIFDLLQTKLDHLYLHIVNIYFRSYVVWNSNPLEVLYLCLLKNKKVNSFEKQIKC